MSSAGGCHLYQGRLLDIKLSPLSLCQPQITQNDMRHVVTGTTIDFATRVHPRAA